MILLDIGLTLLGGPSRSPASFISGLLSLPHDKKRLISDIVFTKHISSAESLIGHLSSVLAMKFSDSQRSALIDYWNNQLTECLPLSGADEFCGAIIGNKYPYSIASNLWKPFHMALTRFLPGIELNAQHLFLSYLMGSRKPGEEFYDRVYSTIAAPPEAVIMVGDSLENDIIPCLARGSTCIVLDRSGNALERYSEKLPEIPQGKLFVAKNHGVCLDLLKSLI